MKKRDALKLRPGDHVVYANSMFTQNATWMGRGTVIRVTPKGGILLRAQSGDSEWTAYHLVVCRETLPREDWNAVPLEFR